MSYLSGLNHKTKISVLNSTKYLPLWIGKIPNFGSITAVEPFEDKGFQAVSGVRNLQLFNIGCLVMRCHSLITSAFELKPSRRFLIATLASTAVFLSACGSRNDDSEVAAYQGESADNVATESLQRNAANNSGKGIGTAMDSVLQTISGSSAISKAFSIPGLGFTSSQSSAGEGQSDGIFNDPTDPGPLLNDDFDNRVRTETSSMFDASLGLSGSSTSTRQGNIVTIDPDENDVCAQQNIDDSLDLATCTALLADLTVTINASSDQSGLITYLFRNEPVFEIGYSPVSGSYELNLAALNKVMKRMAELDASIEPVSATMSGSIKFEANVLNATAGAEAASLKLSIPEAVSIVNPVDGTNVSLAPSTIMQMTADSGTGAASVEIGLGALAIASKDPELVGSPLQQLVMSGLTAKADLTSNGDVLTMSNVGIGNGPLVLSIDSLEAVRLSLDTFGFVVNQNSNSIAMTADMNLDLMMRNVLGYLDAEQSHESSIDYSVDAAKGTTFSELASGDMRVDAGGPLAVEFAVFDGSSSSNGTISVGQGECFGDNGSTDAPIELVGCN